MMFMLIALFRSAILYVFIIFTVRIMGKRQIGELQPAELVVTIMLSEILVIPMQDSKIPLINTIIPVLLVVGLEILVSVLSLKSVKFRSALQGNSLLVIRNGILDQAQLKRLRFSTDDLLEALRKKDVFDISKVEYAMVETDGSLSVLLKPEEENPTRADFKMHAPDNGIPCVVVSDGQIIESDFKDCGMTPERLMQILTEKGLKASCIMLMTADKAGNLQIIEKEPKK